MDRKVYLEELLWNLRRRLGKIFGKKLLGPQVHLNRCKTKFVGFASQDNTQGFNAVSQAVSAYLYLYEIGYLYPI